ncbi:MAG TPA: PHP domain-containing protein [Halanaerobiaceae bacterium]|nr:PHP domain-containing protein [Halanaerobiaceae bacterium]
MPADLHLHSIYSDGSCTPARLIELAREKGLDTVALADHDTVAGIGEMIEAGAEKGIQVIPAIEFSTYQGEVELHILGYFIDYSSPSFQAEIKKLYEKRKERAAGMIARLNELGVRLSYQEVRNLAGSDYIGRSHIARAMVEAGHIREMKDAFSSEYIGNGGQAYLPKYKLDTAETIQLIHEYGGLAVLAHPYYVNGRDFMDKEGIEVLVKYGLDGLEVYHSKHSREATAYYLQIARELGLLVSGGSDFHGANSPGLEIGDIRLADKYVKRIRDYYQKRKTSSRLAQKRNCPHII